MVHTMVHTCLTHKNNSERFARKALILSLTSLFLLTACGGGGSGGDASSGVSFASNNNLANGSNATAATTTPTPAPIITNTATPTPAPIITNTATPTPAPVITNTPTPTALPAPSLSAYAGKWESTCVPLPEIDATALRNASTLSPLFLDVLLPANQNLKGSALLDVEITPNGNTTGAIAGTAKIYPTSSNCTGFPVDATLSGNFVLDASKLLGGGELVDAASLQISAAIPLLGISTPLTVINSKTIGQVAGNLITLAGIDDLGATVGALDINGYAQSLLNAALQLLPAGTRPPAATPTPLPTAAAGSVAADAMDKYVGSWRSGCITTDTFGGSVRINAKFAKRSATQGDITGTATLYLNSKTCAGFPLSATLSGETSAIGTKTLADGKVVDKGYMRLEAKSALLGNTPLSLTDGANILYHSGVGSLPATITFGEIAALSSTPTVLDAEGYPDSLDTRITLNKQ